MTLRRYSPLKPSRGTEIPADVRRHVEDRDRGCVGARLGMPGPCTFGLEIDHVRSSGALGKKSRSTPDNLCCLCPVHHWLKTHHGRTWRPVLLAYLADREATA